MADWKIDLSQNSGVVPPMWNMESGGSKPTNLSKEQILANAQLITDGGMCLNSEGKKVGCNTLIANVPQGVGQVKQTFLEKHQNHLILVGVPVGFYAFSKYKKYDNKKTLKVTIIGSVVVLGAIVLNSLTGMWSGTTFMDSKFGKQKYW